MGIFKTEEKMLNRDKQLEPGWYPWEIVDVEDKPSKSDGSNNCWVTVEGIGEANRYVQVSILFNEKWSPILIPFIKGALGVEPKAGDDFNFDSKLKGRQFDGYNQPKLYESKLRNNLVDFRPLGSTA
jgi:hypothetical protein